MSEHMSQLPPGITGSYTRSRPLPPYRGILAVDAKDFTGRPAIEHEAISRAVPDLLRTALVRAELLELWENRAFPATTGDGYVFGFDPALMPFVVHPLLLTLQEVLTDYNVLSHGVAPIRLRASLHIGPLPDTGDEFGGNGTARNDTHRLLDSRPVKAVLASHKENITHVAAILSDRCYEDAVAGGYTGRHLDHFVEAAATVDGKPFSQRAWIYVPQPSGPLYDQQAPGKAAQEPAPEAVRPAGKREKREKRGSDVRNSAPRGNINTGTVHGGQSVDNSRATGDHIAGDYVGGNKAKRVRGFQGDQVRGDKRQGRK
ncbi:hypothetical protein K7395_06730 [Streptomyces filamentosus]|uniref:Fe2OG dioxygenase domain-containing protein n=2 Tax=Streptomyces filamentosus TaxID=67294 RepID=A0ABY4UVV2_STRFL|nr:MULTISPECIES: hypothetical protein [Streptomyces]EFE78211.1 conserved hypothetical protein [Streptomyces filamentosus NRRL 15998]ESU50345.1 hypothetical protein P376_1677 [Streptomyces sp. HCCB10043]EWS95114.1 hypothetical protein SSIG_05813 [Streptomyces filamentosus NRRL 11379]MYR82101.1 hypothetical protein [Streptomyces sp. SID5466]USC46454.1 hypothetical protein K7395_06730 [Streptomyces filamentosus]